ncbi:MAG: monovalent cation/H(+) antiporter subunit G [Chloroflexi bacterium]|nr:monovalent cation/H(+) antiporter subunit G [Chloroflexota bacterium]
MAEWAELIAACLALGGAAFLGLAALALHRMPDIYGRLSATSKAVTLGATMLLASAAVHTLEVGVTARAVAGIAFLLLTSPIAGHMLGRAAWRSGMEAQVHHQDEFLTGPSTRVVEREALDPTSGSDADDDFERDEYD